MKKVLIIGTVWVEPNSSAAGSRMLQLIKLFLEDGCAVTFATTAQKTANAVDLTSMNVTEELIELNASSFDLFVNDLQPTIVVFDRFMCEEQFGWRVADQCPKAIRILDTEDLHSLRKVRQEALKKQQEFVAADLLNSDIAKREIAAIFRCDLSLIISTFEMELLQNLFKIDASILYHLPFLCHAIDDETQKNWKSFEERDHFVTIGNFLHAPNVDVVLQLKKNLWSEIRKRLPSAEMHVYGAYPTQQIMELHAKKDGFLIKGFTENANEVISKAKVVLAPIRFGAGIKGKLTEAMLNGTPSVSTTIGVEGMHASLPWNGFVCESDHDFIERAVQLFSEQEIWEASQQKGSTIINQLYDKEKLAPLFLTRIEVILDRLIEHRKNNFIGSLIQYQTLRSTKYMSKWIEEKHKN